MQGKWYESFTKPVSVPSQQGLLPLVADLLGLGLPGERLAVALRLEAERLDEVIEMIQRFETNHEL
jgi:hypothetical protein